MVRRKPNLDENETAKWAAGIRQLRSGEPRNDVLWEGELEDEEGTTPHRVRRVSSDDCIAEVLVEPDTWTATDDETASRAYVRALLEAEARRPLDERDSAHIRDLSEYLGTRDDVLPGDHVIGAAVRILREERKASMDADFGKTVDRETWDKIVDATKRVAEKMGIRLPDDISEHTVLLVMVNAVPRISPPRET